MKKILAIFAFLLLNFQISAQYMIIGKDSISLANFKKEYAYGLEHKGVENTIKTTQDFILLQQFAQAKKADTAASFREGLWQRESELRKESFFPKEVKDPLLQDFVDANKTEKKVLVFMIQKEETDKQDYQKIYDEVKSGKLTMEEAINTYAKVKAEPIYVKPGSLDNTLYNDLRKLQNGGYTQLINNSNFVAFAKLLDSRPSLGYIIFGSISYPNDFDADKQKEKIYADLKAGKKFEEVARTYGSSENEKKNAGVVLGSPTLPDEIYNDFKGKQKGYYTQPILMNNKYYIFNIYQIYPYALNDETRDFYFREMQNTLYAETLQDKMLAYIKAQPGFKEFPVSQNLKKSYTTFAAYKNDQDVLYQYNGIKKTVGDLKKMIAEYAEEAKKLTPQQWSEAYDNLENQNLMNAFSEDFANRKEIKIQLDETKKALYSDYVFSKYLKQEVENHPEWLTDYYNKNKSKYFWEKRAKGRVAIIADSNLINEVKKQIKDSKNWETLQKQYLGKLNAQNQILVHFEEGEMSEGADVFTKYKVPYEKGVHTTKMEKRDLVIAIDDLLPPTQMTEQEAIEMLKDDVTDLKLNEVISEQRAKTKIVVQPEFLQDLEKNFKK